MKKTAVKRTIRSRIFWPIITVVSVQLIALFLVFIFGGLVTRVTSQSFENLQGKTQDKKIYVQNKMVKEWGNISDYDTIMTELMETFLQENSIEFSSLTKDSEETNQLLMYMSDNLINMLRDTKTTGAYIILNPQNSKNGKYPGLYIRDLEPNTSAEGNSDLMMQVGMPKVSKELNFSLTSYWTADFDLENGNYSSGEFFDVPYQDAIENPGKSLDSYGYWSKMYQLDPASESVISYSMPICLSDGTVAGVIGVDIQEGELEDLLDSGESNNNNKITYMIGCLNSDEKQLQTIKYLGNLYVQEFGSSDSIQFREKDESFISFLGGSSKVPVYELYKDDQAGNEKILGCMEQLKLYNKDSSHLNQEWNVLVFQKESTIFADTYYIERYLVIICVGTLLLMIVAIALVSLRISRPIQRLADEIQHTEANHELQVEETNILELDNLLKTFQEVRNISVEYADRLSDIVELSNLPIGIFEYNHALGAVFCSRSLFDVLAWDLSFEEQKELTPEILKSKIDEVESNVYDDERSIYRIKDLQGKDKWVQLHLETTSGKILGVFSDITHEILEQERIAYERDYDVLTGLLNRRAFKSKVFDVKEKDLKIGAAVMIDSDNLKYVNDNYGHEAGDQYLSDIARLISSENEKDHTIAGRRSGDEFYLLFYGYEQAEIIREKIKNIWKLLETNPMELDDGSKINLSCSAGVAWYPKDSTDILELFNFADAAMYKVKKTSKSNWREHQSDRSDQINISADQSK